MTREVTAERAGVAWEPTDTERAVTILAREGLVAARRLRAGADAIEAAALSLASDVAQAQLRRSDPSGTHAFPFRAMAAELGCAVRESSGTMQTRMANATVLASRFPDTLRALTDARITARLSEIIRDHGDRLPDPERRDFEARALAFAEDSSPAQLRTFAKQLAEQLTPRSFRERHHAARHKRGVWLRDLEDGMAELHLVADAVAIHGAHSRLTAMGKKIACDNRRIARERRETATVVGPSASAACPSEAATGAGPGAPRDAFGRRPDTTPGEHGATEENTLDTRTLDQLRADLAIDLLLSGAPTGHSTDDEDGCRDPLAAITPIVQVTIPVATLTGLDDNAAFLAGHGPIDADTARQLAANATGWDRLYLHPDTGALHTVDRYTPTAAQRRLLAARDETCRFPYCRTPAHRSETDHTIPYSQRGPTDVRNIAHLCKGHHRDKHHTPWTVTQTSPGVLEWTSPTGTTYTDRPQPQVRFTALTDDSSPPF